MTVVRVALVGAGPGDPDLVTLRAEAELAAASTVMTDMALESLVRQLAPQAEVVMVPDGQPAASVLLAVVARADGDVVRLYSGDPWLHPAHVVELTALNRAGIGSKPVPGCLPRWPYRHWPALQCTSAISLSPAPSARPGRCRPRSTRAGHSSCPQMATDLRWRGSWRRTARLTCSPPSSPSTGRTELCEGRWPSWAVTPPQPGPASSSSAR